MSPTKGSVIQVSPFRKRGSSSSGSAATGNDVSYRCSVSQVPQSKSLGIPRIAHLTHHNRCKDPPFMLKQVSLATSAHGSHISLMFLSCRGWSDTGPEPRTTVTGEETTRRCEPSGYVASPEENCCCTRQAEVAMHRRCQV